MIITMAFFEELKRGASEVADKVVKKTTDITAIAKVNINIKASEAKLNSVYEEIGYLFYTAERNGVDNTEAIAAQVLKADGIIVEIDNLKRESAKLRNVVICPACGSEIDTECLFCPVCGQKQEVPEPKCDCGCECSDEECSCEECDCEECDCTDDCGCECEHSSDEE